MTNKEASCSEFQMQNHNKKQFIDWNIGRGDVAADRESDKIWWMPWRGSKVGFVVRKMI